MTQPDQIEGILIKTAEYFGIPRELLNKNYGNRSGIWKYKRYLIVILMDNFDMTFTQIGKLLNYKTPQNVSYSYHQLKNELSDDFFGYEKVKKTYKRLIEYIGL